MERSATMEVGADDDRQVLEFVHDLGCEVIVQAFDADDRQVGIGGAVEITENEVEVIVLPGLVRRLVAVPRPPDDED